MLEQNSIAVTLIFMARWIVLKLSRGISCKIAAYDLTKRIYLG